MIPTTHWLLSTTWYENNTLRGFEVAWQSSLSLCSNDERHGDGALGRHCVQRYSSPIYRYQLFPSLASRVTSLPSIIEWQHI
jgi:hypothetical protein